MASLNVKFEDLVPSMSVVETADTQDKTPKSKEPSMVCPPATPQQKDEATPSVEHDEEATGTPRCSESTMDDEKNAETDSEHYNDLQNVAERDLTRQAEELFTKIFNAKDTSEPSEFDQLKGEIRQMAQSFNEKGALYDSQAAERYDHNPDLQEEELDKQQGKICKDNRAASLNCSWDTGFPLFNLLSRH
jgi:hypothetical protein